MTSSRPTGSGLAKLLLALLGLACLGSPPVLAAPKGNVALAQQLAADAKTAYLARDYEKAAELYTEALRQVEHPNLLFTQARSLEQLARFSHAAIAFARAADLLPAGAEREVFQARAAANRKLDEAQQALADGLPAQAQPAARAAHSVLFAQSKRAADGQIYPEPASVPLLLARIELALGNGDAAQSLLADVRADPTAPPKLVERAEQLTRGEPAAPRPPVVPEPKPAVPEPQPIAQPPPSAGPAPPAPAAPKLAQPVARSAPAPVARVAQQAEPQRRPLAPKLALGASAAVAIAGAAWWGVSAAQASELQGKLDDAKATGRPVDGMSQQDYVERKASADRGYQLGSALAIGGGVAVAGSVAWLALAGRELSVAAAPAPGGWAASVAVAW